MSRIKWSGLVALAALALTGCGPGGNVYVGVGVAGPWVGPAYPGYYPRPPMYGPPPCCWDEEDAEDLQDPLLDLDLDLNLTPALDVDRAPEMSAAPDPIPDP